VQLNADSVRVPSWSCHRRWIRGRIPPVLVSWLLDAGSLTDRLKQACSGRFEVRVLDEGWRRPRLDEARVLGMSDSTLGWVRQVQLLCDGRPWVFARTIIPVTSLTGPQRRLAHLGNRPLGAFLFADPGMQRGSVELARIRKGQAMFAEATSGLTAKSGEIWGRRSVFRVGGKPLLVTEVFLPAIETVYGSVV
jgi:chorismate--pyruvate lyase